MQCNWTKVAILPNQHCFMHLGLNITKVETIPLCILRSKKSLFLNLKQQLDSLSGLIFNCQKKIFYLKQLDSPIRPNIHLSAKPVFRPKTMTWFLVWPNIHLEEKLFYLKEHLSHTYSRLNATKAEAISGKAKFSADTGNYMYTSY